MKKEEETFALFGVCVNGRSRARKTPMKENTNSSIQLEKKGRKMKHSTQYTAKQNNTRYKKGTRSGNSSDSGSSFTTWLNVNELFNRLSFISVDWLAAFKVEPMIIISQCSQRKRKRIEKSEQRFQIKYSIKR